MQFQNADYFTGPVPYAIAAGDFNGDGYLDIVTANIGNIDSGQGNNTIGVLLNNGDGTFAPAVSYTVGNEPNRIVVGDFHGKGKPDIVVVNIADQTVSLLSNKGNGTFGAQKIIENFTVLVWMLAILTATARWIWRARRASSERLQS